MNDGFGVKFITSLGEIGHFWGSIVTLGWPLYTISNPPRNIDMVHYALEATPTKMKSTGRSEGCSNNVMTSPVTTKNFKIGPLGDFEKKMFKNFHHPPPSELLSELTHVARIGPK